MGNPPHVVVVPFPAQGHVLPLFEVALRLVDQGMKVTFVNTDVNHNRLVKALADRTDVTDRIGLVSIPEGFEIGDDRNDLGAFFERSWNFMPQRFEEVMREMNESGEDEVTCIVGDYLLGWAMKVAKRMGIKGAVFCPCSVASEEQVACLTKFLDEGITDDNGTAIRTNMIKLSPTMPAMDPAKFAWSGIFNMRDQKILFDGFRSNNELLKLADRYICNSTYDLESAALAMAPHYSPIGPLLATNGRGSSAGCFWSEDLSCIDWLDRQEACSVTYVAFGSTTLFDRTQFQELVLGLELTYRPFLMVVRPDWTASGENGIYPEGFLERVADRGRIVEWAPQQKALSHPAVACFVSHCGWNSTVEGVANAIPFLCWPYFCDQFVNETYICDVWKVGLRLEKDGNGIIARHEIKAKVEKLLGDGGFKERAIDLKDKAMSSVKEGGHSYNNFKKFIEWIKV